jgi:phage shock protein B
MLDSMYETARRLEERLATVERIIAADNPDFRPDVRPTQPLRDDDYRFDRRN